MRFQGNPIGGRLFICLRSYMQRVLHIKWTIYWCIYDWLWWLLFPFCFNVFSSGVVMEGDVFSQTILFELERNLLILSQIHATKFRVRLVESTKFVCLDNKFRYLLEPWRQALLEFDLILISSIILTESTKLKDDVTFPNNGTYLGWSKHGG